MLFFQYLTNKKIFHFKGIGEVQIPRGITLIHPNSTKMYWRISKNKFVPKPIHIPVDKDNPYKSLMEAINIFLEKRNEGYDQGNILVTDLEVIKDDGLPEGITIMVRYNSSKTIEYKYFRVTEYIGPCNYKTHLFKFTDSTFKDVLEEAKIYAELYRLDYNDRRRILPE